MCVIPLRALLGWTTVVQTTVLVRVCVAMAPAPVTQAGQAPSVSYLPAPTTALGMAPVTILENSATAHKTILVSFSHVLGLACLYW